jgi:Protein of unknown function (DUF3606)
MSTVEDMIGHGERRRLLLLNRAISAYQRPEEIMDKLKIKGEEDRSKINMHEPHEVRHWTKHLGVSKEDLHKAIDKVGNGAAAVRKHLAV